MLDPLMYFDDAVIEDGDFASLDQDRATSLDRFYGNAKVKVGDYMKCAACGTTIVKTGYHQKFCRSTNRYGQKVKYPCKEKFHDLMGSRGETALLKA